MKEQLVDEVNTLLFYMSSFPTPYFSAISLNRSNTFFREVADTQFVSCVSPPCHFSYKVYNKTVMLRHSILKELTKLHQSNPMLSSALTFHLINNCSLRLTPIFSIFSCLILLLSNKYNKFFLCGSYKKST